MAPPQAQDENELAPSLVPQQQPAVHVTYCSRIIPRYFPGPNLDHMLARVDGLPSLPAMIYDEIKTAVPPVSTCEDWEALAAMLSPLKTLNTPFPTHAVAAIPTLPPVALETPAPPTPSHAVAAIPTIPPVTLETPAPPTPSHAVAAIPTLPPDVLARIAANKKANEVAAADVPAGPPPTVHQESLTSLVTDGVAAAAVSAVPARAYSLFLPPANLRRQDGLVLPMLPPPSTATSSFLADELAIPHDNDPLWAPPSLSSTESTLPPLSDKLLPVVSSLPPLPAKRNSRLKLQRTDAVVKPDDSILTSIKPQSAIIIIPPPLPDKDPFYNTFFQGHGLNNPFADWDQLFWC